MTHSAPLLDVSNVSKLFGTFAANSDVSLTCLAGEKHALLGENGAGKSTLVKMIYGVMQPSAGRFLWQGHETVIERPAMARDMGIGMVFQHFSVFEALTVAENIALALPPEPMRALAARIAAVSATYGLAIDPDRPVHTLSVGETQRVEIIRCLLQEPRLLIMDEPTSVLTPQEADALFETLERLAADGCAILYISHKLDEVRALCDRATILRRGAVVATCDPRTTSARDLAEMMVGERIGDVARAARTPGAPMLELCDLSIPAPVGGVALSEVSLTVHAGEIVGIAGVAGEGQTELMDALTGEVRATDADTVTLAGKPLGHHGPTPRRRAGAAFVPEERNGHAAIGSMTLSENIVLSHHAAEGIATGGRIDFAKARDWMARVRKTFDVRAAAEDPEAGSLSGGNLQKFVVGREILRNPRLLVVSQPTWGVDAGAAAVIRQALIDLAANGAAVLVISQDLEEIFEICDRVGVIFRGRVSPPRAVGEVSAESIGLLMAGAGAEAAA